MVKNIPTIERSTKIRFGKYANDNQAENSIVFNASNEAISASTPGSVYMTPLRQASIGSATFIGYDATTKEIVDTNVLTSLLGGISLDDTVKEGPVVSNGIPHFANTLTAFTTRYGSNVGIANTSPIHALDVGENLSITRHGNVLTTGKITAGQFYGDGGTLSNIVPTFNEIILEGNTASSKTVEFNYANGPSLITANTVGISNANPIHTLDVGSNLYAEDTAVDVLNVTGNVNVSNYVKTTNVVASNISLTSITQGDLLVGPSSGTVLEKLAAYTGPSTLSSPAAMSSNSSGGNTASSSGPSAIQANAWKAFDGSDSTSFICREFDYQHFGAYAYWGNTSLSGIYGEWVKIQLTSAITPTSVFVKSQPDGTDSAGRPAQWRILASNDDTTWTQLHSSTTVVDDSSGTTESFTNTTAYTYFAFIVTHINTSNGKWNVSHLLFNYTGSGPTEKFLKSSAAGVSWDEVSSTLQAITDGGASTTNEVSFTNGVTSLTASSNVVVTGNVTAGTFHGDGSSITHLNLGDANNTGQVAIARGGTGVTTGLTALDPANLSSQVLLAKGGTGLTAVSENDLLLGPASGTALTKLSAYAGPTSSTVPAAMSANSSGGNIASSGDSSSDAYKVFDGSDSTNYSCPEDYHWDPPHAYTGSNSLGSVLGEWIKIQLSSAITPTSVFVKANADNQAPSYAGRPQQWRIMGSNDGSMWTQLHSSTTLIDVTNGTTESFTNTTAYSYLGFIVTHRNTIAGGGGGDHWQISRLSFTSSPSGPTEKFLKSSATGVSWDEVSSSLQTITDGGASTTNEVSFTNGVTSLTASGNVVVTGNVTASNIISTNLTSGKIPYTDANKELIDSKVSFNTTTNVTSVASNLVVTGNLTVQGGTIYQDTDVHTITDPIIELGNANAIDTIDMGIIMTRPTANVAAGYRGDEKEYTIAYTLSDPDGSHIVPTNATSDGYITANVWGNVVAGNVTTTGKMTASTFHGDGSAITNLDLGDATNTGQVAIARGGTGLTTVSENDLLLGPASGTALTKLAAYVQTAGSTVPAAMSANSSGGNTASSSDSSSNAYKAFDGSDSTHYASPDPPTYSSGGSYGHTGSNSLGGVSGEWVKIELSSGITPTSVFLKARPENVSGTARPNSWRILGSNDDMAWTQLHSSTTLVDDTNGTTESFTNTIAYDYLAIVVTNINNPGMGSARWTLSRLSFTSSPSGPTEKFLKSSSAGISWDDTISGDGSGLEALNASNVSTGTLTTARGGTGLTTVSENDLLLGPASGTTLSKLSAYTQATGPTSSSPAAMSSNSSGGNTASSGNSSADTYKAFDGSDSTSYQSSQWAYSAAGTYAGLASNSLGGVNGEWVKIQLASAIAPISVFIKGPAPAGQDNLPASWRILGSNDDTNWTQLHTSTTQVTSSGITESFTNTTAYTYLGIVVTNVIPGSGFHFRLSRLSFNYLSGPTEKFLKSSAAGISWDEVSSTLQTITDGGATTTQTVAFNNTTTGLTSAGDIDIAATKQIDYAGDVLIKSSAGTVASFKVNNAIKLDPSYASSSHNVLSINTTTTPWEIYDSGGQGGSTYNNLHEEGANVSIGPSASANLTVNTYGSNVLSVSGNVSADNITIGALHVSASPFNFDDVVSTSAGANVTSNVITVGGLVTSGNVEAGNVIITDNITVADNITVTGNATSQNIKLTNTEISATISSGTITIDAKEKSYGTAPLVTSTDDVSNLIFSNFISGSQIVVPILASGGNIKISKELTNVNFYAMTSDVSVSQDKHALMTLSNVSGNIYMNALAFA